MKRFYLLLAGLGFVLPYIPFGSFLWEHGLNVSLLAQELFVNRISTFFALDVVVSSVVVWGLVWQFGRQRKMRHLWVYVLANLLVGVSFALPLFLYMRERQSEQTG